MTELGGLSARLGLNTAGLKAGRVVAQSELLKTEAAMLRTEHASTRLGGAFGRLGTATKIVGGILGLELAKKAGEGIKVAVEYAADLEATMARVHRVFGDSSEEVVKFSDTTDRTLGRTKDQALTASVRFGTLATRLGQTKEEAAKTSIALTKLAVDLAASKGGSADDAGNALATGLVGRGMALRRYGIVLTDTSLKEGAVKDGLISSTKEALTPAIKLQEAYNTIIRQTTDIQGYFGEHLDLITEKQQVAGATTKSASEALGNALIPAERVFADIMANDVAPALKAVGEGMGFLADHKSTRELVLFGGGLLVVAKVATVMHKAFLTLKADTLELFPARAAATAAIEREGAAAEVAAGQLTLLADAEARSGTAAVGATGERAVGAGAMAIPGLIPGAAGVVGTTAPAARMGGGSMLAAGAAGIGSYELTKGLLNRYGAFGHESDGDRRRIARQDAFSGDNSLLDELKGMHDSSILRLPGAQGNWDKTVLPAIREAISAQDVKANAHAVSVLQDFITATRANTPRTVLAASDAQDRTAARMRAAQADLHDPTVLSAEAGLVGGTLGGAFDELPARTGGNADKIAAAGLAVDSAQARVDKLKAGSASASKSSMLSAQAAVLSAEDTLRKHKGDTTAQTLRLQAAEERLTKLRSRGKVDTGALAVAEGHLAAARKTAAHMSDSTALSVGDLMGRLDKQVQHGKALRDDTTKLIADGIGRSALEQIMQLEKSAPGTMDRLAATMTKAQAKAFNDKTAALTRLNEAFFTAPLRAAEAGAKAANAAAAKRLAVATANAYKVALEQAWRDSGAYIPVAGPPSGVPGSKAGRPIYGPPSGVPGSLSNTYNMPGATIVASDPAALAKALAAKSRRDALSGQSAGHGV